MTIDNQVWRGKVARYQKWQKRRDSAAHPDAIVAYGRMVGRLYVDLSNDARAIVERYREDMRTDQSYYNFTMDETHFITWTRDSTKFNIKVKEEDRERLWFQRNEHEPWFDLGYLNEETGKFQDNPVSLRDRGITPPIKRLSDMEATNPSTVSVEIGKVSPEAMAILSGKAIEMTQFTTPEELEAAATHALAEAARIRAIDDSEPAGDEPTISWEYTPNFADARTYTYVAFKAGNGRWYVTGERQFGRAGVSWRELYGNAHSENIREGNYLIVAEWAQGGGE